MMGVYGFYLLCFCLFLSCYKAHQTKSGKKHRMGFRFRNGQRPAVDNEVYSGKSGWIERRPSTLMKSSFPLNRMSEDCSPRVVTALSISAPSISTMAALSNRKTYVFSKPEAKVLEPALSKSISI